MAATAIQATENNQKLFRQYTKKLSQDDVTIYTSHADKLGRWLSDGKAYYKSARPEIVKLLMTAQSTLRRNVGADLNPMSPFNATLHLDHPMSAPYIRLIQTVKPFTYLFVEPDLKSFVGRMVQSASSEPVTEYAPAGSPPASLSSDLFIPQMPSVSGSYVPSHSSIRTSTGSPSFSVVEVQSTTSQQNPGVTVPAYGESISANVSKPKVKKKGRLDLSALLKKDVVALQQKKLEASGGAISSSSNLGQGPVVPSIKAEPIENLPTQADQVSQNTVVPTGMHVVNEHFSSSMTALVPLQRAIKQPEIIDLTIDDSDGEANPEPIILQQVETMMDVDAKPNHPMDVDNNPALGNMLHNNLQDDSAPHFPPITPNSFALQPIQDHVSPRPITAVEHVFEMDESSISTKQEDMTIIHPMHAENESSNFGASSELVNFQPEIYGETNPETPKEPTLSEDNINMGGPGEDLEAAASSGNGMKVIAIQRGLESGSKISIQYEMPEAQFPKLSKWLNCKDHTEPLQDCLCLSLACYSSLELLERINEGTPYRSHEELVSTLQSLWPTSGGLSMTLQQTEIKEFPLSPPFLVTEDGFVDISQFVTVGQNTIELNHQTELKNYTFVLYAHHPTGSQLQQIAEQRDKERQWLMWSHHVSRPLNLVDI